VLPFARGNLSSSVAVDGSERDDLEVEFRSLAGGYFEAMGMSLLRGRGVGSEDTRETPPVTVVNGTLAQRSWGDADPIGGTITIFETTWTVVGVVSDVRHFGLAEPPVPEMYVSFQQQPRRYLTHVLHTDGDLGALAAAARRIVDAVDPELPITDVATMDERVQLSAAAPRFRTGVLGALALAALILSVVGVYGVAAFAVSRRTREIGIRRALGAQTGVVIALVVGRGMLFVGVGTAAGAAVAAALAGYLRSLLFEIEPLDAFTFAAATAVILGAALLGSIVPALRAAAVDPVTAIGDASGAR
jgi:putative ABC transport system permease protein